VVKTPSGILFKGNKGIYLLTRGGESQYVGAPVEGYNSSQITSATLLETLNQVHFTTSDDVCLVYEYLQNRWSTDENLGASDALLYNGNFSYLRADGTVLVQSGYDDNGDYIPLALESSWIQLAGIQGFQRFYKMLVLGKYYNAHKVAISFAYDFEDQFVDETVVDATTLFGNDGGVPLVYQFDVSPKRQKCEAFKFRITTTYDGVYGAECDISNFMLVLGTKASANKIKATSKVGADSV